MKMLSKNHQASSGTRRLLGCLACVAPFCAFLAIGAANDPNYSQLLSQGRFFDDHLEWSGGTAPSATESEELWRAFGVGQSTNLDQVLDTVESFLQSQPNSPWSASLHANLAKHYYETVRFTLALNHYEAAWLGSKTLTDKNGRDVADFALVNWLRLLTSLGRTDTLKTLLDETQSRQILRSYQEQYRTAREAYGFMLRHPGLAYKCGTFALDAVSKVLYGTNKFEGLLEEPSPSTGFSMARLAELAQRGGLDLIPVVRTSGEELVVPSVVNWKQQHYAAIIAQKGDLYQVVDPTFLMTRWETAGAINAEANGNFMISSKQLPAGWRALTLEESSAIFGKGFPGFILPSPNPPCPTNACCAPGGGGGGGSPGNQGSQQDKDKNKGDSTNAKPMNTGFCASCGQFAAGPGGMPRWTVLEPNIDVWIEDEPLGYQPATGPRISASVHYDERSMVPEDKSIFGMGPSWGFSWFSYIVLSSSTLYSLGGGSITYSDITGTVPNYYNNTRMLNVTGIGGVTTAYKIIYPSGATNIYGFIRTDTFLNPQQAFLTQTIDPAGRATTFVYDPTWDPSTNDVIRLLYVVDADGLTNRISYTNAVNLGTNLICQIVDPYNRTNRFAYDQNGNLTNITDVAGLTTTFKYGVPAAFPGNTWITNMTTPYGTTTFDYVDPYSSSVDDRGIVITDPDGGQEMFFYGGDASFDGNPEGLPQTYTDTSNVPTSRPTGSTLGNPDWSNPSIDDKMKMANSFYWNREQFANLPAAFLSSGPTWDFTKLGTNDFFNARLRHWNPATANYQGNNLSMERLPSPDHIMTGKMIWYDYPGNTGGTPYWSQGTSAWPSLVIEVLPDGSNWYEQYVIDQWGNRTNVISTYTSGGSVLTRTNKYIYSADGSDLLFVIAPDGVTQGSYVYTNHLIRFFTNAVGDVTTYTYNANWQVTSVTYPTQLISTNIYYSNGFVATNYDYCGSSYFRSNYFTYTNGLVYTRTDERGLTVTNTWDNLQRLTKESYLNGSVSYTYNNLDLVQIVDRLGYTTSFGYDSIRRKIAQTNAMGAVITYGYCPCGGLSYITNALTQVTQFVYDYQGNLVATLYPDGYNVTNQYNTVRELIQTADTGGMRRTNSYNNQGLVLTVSNAFGQVWAAVYDIDDRPTSQTDADGVTVTMTYDNLGRAVSRSSPDSGSEGFGYSSFGLIVYTNQLHATNYYAYDASWRKTFETNSNWELTQFQYSRSGDLTNLVDGRGNNTKWNYDQYGRLTNKLDAASNVLFTYGYDADDRLTARTNATSIWTLFFYDKTGNLTNVVYPHNANITNTYDVLDRVTKMVDGLGATSYSYDSASHVLSEGGLWADDTVSYTYQNRLRTGLGLLSPDASSWTQSYSYDSARRLTSLSSPAGAFSYGYDANRHMQIGKLTLPNSAYITNTYDSVARLLSTTLKNNANAALNSHNYGYNLGNQRTALTNFSGDYRQYTYDKIGQLKTAIGNESGGSPRLQEQLGYAYDTAGNLNFRTNNALTQTFNVNTLNELTTVGRSGTFTVAGTTTTNATGVTVNTINGNRYNDATFALGGFTLANGNNSYTAIAQDALGRHDTNSITVNLPSTITCTYDLNGNLTSDGTRWFAYDDEEQLVSVWVTNGWRSDFAYDGRMRRRVRREWTWLGGWIQTNEVRYVYDANLPIQERDINNRPMVTYTRGSDLSGTPHGAGGIGGLLARTDHRVLAIGDVSANAYYHADGNGNVTALLNTNQYLVAKYLYDPFGNVLSQSGPLAAANSYQFSSKEFHPNSGLMYYLYRFYDPNLERWPNRDPLSENGGVNLFRFSANAPTRFIDSDGRQLILAPLEAATRISVECSESSAAESGMTSSGIGIAPPIVVVGPQSGSATTPGSGTSPGPSCHGQPAPKDPVCGPQFNPPFKRDPKKDQAQQDCLDRVSKMDAAVRKRGSPPLTREEKQKIYDDCMADHGYPVERPNK